MQDWKLEPARDLGMSLGERSRSLRRECGLIETAAHLGWWSLMRAYLRVGHRLTVHGREHLPSEPPFVLVANHTSHLDALVLAANARFGGPRSAPHAHAPGRDAAALAQTGGPR